ncbi:MAG: hypothetical protein N3D82_01545 [Ignisphaera sp.]|nr:hypothetical protein [Ignisphaera sp.]
MAGASLKTVIATLLTDSVIWGIWFGGLWLYRPVLAARLTSSYTHIAVSTAMPLIAASATYIASGFHEEFIRKYRVALFKLSIVLSRVVYLLTSYIILANLLDGLELLYTVSIGFTVANAISSLAGIAWADYVADNVPTNLKSRYVALDSILGTVGALIGTSIAGALLYEVQSIASYGKLFMIISTILLTNTPILTIFIREFNRSSTVRTNVQSTVARKAAQNFYLATVIIYLSVNLSAPIIPPFIIHRFGGNELWITLTNGANQVASLVAPMMWSIVIESLGSLNATKIATILAVIANITFPFMPTLHLQIVRAFLAGASGIGIWVTLFSYLVRDVDSGHRIRYIAKVFTIQNLVPAIAMNLGGALADILSTPEIVFLLSAVGFASLALLGKS